MQYLVHKLAWYDNSKGMHYTLTYFNLLEVMDKVEKLMANGITRADMSLWTCLPDSSLTYPRQPVD